MNEDLLGKARSLLQAGQAVEAANAYQQFLRGNPYHAEARYELGMMYLQSHQFEQAEILFGEVLQLHPQLANVHCVRGVSLARLQRTREALLCFDRALALKPDSTDALINRGTVFQQMRRFDEALGDLNAALALDPFNALGWNNLGTTYMAMKRFDEAVTNYDKALALKPDLQDAVANRATALVERGSVARCPPAYISALFDETSSHYDEMMLGWLGYRGHAHLLALALKVLPQSKTPSWRILDLGCGTGLVGEVFKDMKIGGRLDGIDLSPRMIEASRKLGIYDDLILGDIETVLAQPGPHYDLALAADTMVYFGDLEPSLSGVANRLEAGGFYLFAVESKEGEGWDKQPTHRFRHSESYLRDVAARTDFRIVEIDKCILRHEESIPVEGLAVALQKPNAV